MVEPFVGDSNLTDDARTREKSLSLLDARRQRLCLVQHASGS